MLSGVLASCASAPGSDARALADAGTRATASFARDAGSLSRRLTQGDATAAFTATWTACAQAQQGCAPRLPDDAAQAQRQELASTLLRRAEAVAALQKAYDRFRAQAQPAGPGRTQETVRKALTGLWSVGTTLAGAPASIRPPAPPAALEASVGYAAELRAARVSDKRLRRTSAELATAIQSLRAVILAEIRLYDAVAELVVREKTDAQRALFQAGLLSPTDALRPLVDSLGVPLARDADAVVARSPTVRIAVEAVIAASERADIDRTQRRYRSSLEVLGELELLHRNIDAGDSLDMARLDEALARFDLSVSEADAKARGPGAAAS